MRTFTKSFLCFNLFLLLFCLLDAEFAYPQDTVKSVDLDSVLIEDTQISIQTDIVSGDYLSKKHLSNINVQSAGDAAKFLGGVLVKDYGGLGGIKTVSVRGLSSNHTSVMYDGVSLFDNQSGQIDLSKYSLSNINSLSLANAQFSEFLPTAASLAYASSVNLQTRRPEMGANRFKGDLSLTYGSFNLFNAGLFTAAKLSDKDIITVLGDLTNTDGRYTYKMYYGAGQSLSTDKMKRENNDMFSSHAEVNWFHTFSLRNTMKAKVYYYYSERGLPSNVNLYYQNSKQRLWNGNLFAQSEFTSLVSNRLTYKNSVKVDWNYTRYKDPHYLSGPNGQDDRYTQKFVYMNNCLNVKLTDNAFVTFTDDLSYNSLDYTLLETVPERVSSLTAAVLTCNTGNWTFTADGVHSYYKDKFKLDGRTYNYFSPFFSVKYARGGFSSVLFYKNIFRMPTFNELYYRRSGNTALKPEKTYQLSLSNAYSFSVGNVLLRAEADIYYNNVKDKIVAIPLNQFLWSMLNYGKVDIYGCDIKTGAVYNIAKDVNLDLKINYSYQKGVDMDENSYTYKQDIPYMPRNVGSAVLGFEYGQYKVAYTCLYVGDRYSLQENIPQNLLKSYAEHGFNCSYTAKINRYKAEKLCLTASVNNIFNKQYEIIRAYPMMGRNFNLKVQIFF